MNHMLNSSFFFFGGQQGQEKMKTGKKLGSGDKENHAPAAEISPSSGGITYPVLPSPDPATKTTANVPEPFILAQKSPKRRLHPSAPSTSSTVPRSASLTTNVHPTNNPNPGNQRREPLFLTRNHHSHSTDIEIMQSAGRQACLKRGLHPSTPCNVGRPRARLGFLTESPARKGRAEGVRGIFAGSTAEVGRMIGGERVEKGDEVEDDEFEDAVVVLGSNGSSSQKSNTRPNADSTSASEEEGQSGVKAAKPVRSSQSVMNSGRISPRIARLPLSRRNVAMLDAAPTQSSSEQTALFSPGPGTKVRGCSRFAPRPGNANTCASTSASNSKSRYDTSNAAGSFSPSRMFDAPPRRNPARLTKAKEKQASKLSEVHVPTTTTSMVSAFSTSSSSESDSSTPAWTDDEIFLRRHESSRSSKQARTSVRNDQRTIAKESTTSAKVVDKVVGSSGTPGQGFARTGGSAKADSKTAPSADGLALEMGYVAIRSKRKQRGKKVRAGAKTGEVEGGAAHLPAKRTLEGLRLDQGGE